MTMYTISPRSESHFEPFTVRAASHGEAATRAAKRLHGRRAVAERQTGIGAGSGIFQAYVPWRLGGATSIGGNFHVQES